MGLPKRRPVITPKEQSLRMHVETIRRKELRFDRDGEYFERCVELAREIGADVEHVFEEWSERAACRMYLGELELDVAEAAAFEDVKERLCGR